MLGMNHFRPVVIRYVGELQLSCESNLTIITNTRQSNYEIRKQLEPDGIYITYRYIYCLSVNYRQIGRI